MLEQAPAASAPMCFLRVARASREDLALGGGLQPKLDFGQARRGVGRRTLSEYITTVLLVSAHVYSGVSSSVCASHLASLSL